MQVVRSFKKAHAKHAREAAAIVALNERMTTWEANPAAMCTAEEAVNTIVAALRYGMRNLGVLVSGFHQCSVNLHLIHDLLNPWSAILILLST